MSDVVVAEPWDTESQEAVFLRDATTRVYDAVPEWRTELQPLVEALAEGALPEEIFGAHGDAVLIVTAAYRHFWPVEAQTELRDLAFNLTRRVWATQEC